MNPVLEIIVGKYYISIIRKNNTELYPRNARNFLRVVRFTQPELLPYLSVQ